MTQIRFLQNINADYSGVLKFKGIQYVENMRTTYAAL